MKIATGKVIKALRKHLNYKQEFVAKKLNITTATLANIENGRVALDIEKLYLIALLFEVAPRVILGLAIEIYENKADYWLESALKRLRKVPTDEPE